MDAKDLPFVLMTTEKIEAVVMTLTPEKNSREAVEAQLYIRPCFHPGNNKIETFYHNSISVEILSYLNTVAICWHDAIWWHQPSYDSITFTNTKTSSWCSTTETPFRHNATAM